MFKPQKSMRIRHLIAAVVIAGLGVAAFAGFIGPAIPPERITNYDVSIIVTDNGVRYTEVIDYDFGRESRHGIYRMIPANGADISEISVSSPDAPDQFTLNGLQRESLPSGPEAGASLVEDEIRIGDPNKLISGRHRYILSYTLSVPQAVGGRLALNTVGNEFDVPIEKSRSTVYGVDLDSPACYEGPVFSDVSCTFANEDGRWVAEVDGLESHEGVSVEGTIKRFKPSQAATPLPFEQRDGSLRTIWAAIVIALGTIATVAVYWIMRQIGRNDVADGGATDAAFAGYGHELFGSTEAPTAPPPSVRRVPDSKMKELTGIEFVPPGNTAPWQAAVANREVIDDKVVGSWFAALASAQIIAFDGEAGTSMSVGPKAAEADTFTASILNTMFHGRSKIELGSYDAGFARSYNQVGQMISTSIAQSGMFKARPPQSVRSKDRVGSGLLPIALVGGFMLLGALQGLVRFAPVTVLIAVALPAAIAAGLYGFMRRALSAQGSALALRTESFRKFLHESEAEHVKWAWDNGLLRDYSVWAVALDEADAWNSSMSKAAIPPAELVGSRLIMVPSLYPVAFSSAFTHPTSSGGGSGGFGGGGGFSGGGIGGGGGGSW